jgi:hypothetical protein
MLTTMGINLDQDILQCFPNCSISRSSNLSISSFGCSYQVQRIRQLFLQDSLEPEEQTLKIKLFTFLICALIFLYYRGSLTHFIKNNFVEIPKDDQNI